MAKFTVTYEIWDESAAEAGETDDRGVELENGSLREAIDAVLSTRTNKVSGVECVEPSDSRIEHARSITVANGMEYETGAYEYRTIHIPDSVSSASRRRIAALVGVNI